MKVTILGCGPSSGVPVIGNIWGRCDPDNPKNRRRRPSILVEGGGTRVLVDTAPDLREQFLDAGIATIDAVLYTHDHADHLNGIDDLRMVRRHMERNIDVYAAPETLRRILRRFGYVFAGVEVEDDLYRPICDGHEISGPVTVGALVALPLEQDHGICRTLGFRFGRFAYSTDVVALPDETLAALEGVDTWVVDCLRDGEAHPTHANLDTTLGWIERVAPRRAVLTHMNHQADYATLAARLPRGVEPAYDGLVLEVPD